ncbi:MAG: GtrA family protein [Winkia neuii]|uniref:GtrA family protein n=1 Tax=Winkia neuii TaxID=33007 RepID=UPI000462CC5F|nr:GtrA family protein [Winkia neuii]OFJ71569.1 hypothetical protein HMPREF2851_06995 [Actinomyces sp. HMSC064C12]OFK01110.1 hypothetical protein HMPREF2835_10095 [Actinomyces sp. HMSC072A03]OFT55847.1 hypothetical protein HMPREF3152_04120 [Actinomyces sp. HMSC06A08]KWZ73082.1 GtrA-like protein [Winkia neuii]MDK8098959.1 GtrA family protein [Winkia neuii]
MRLLTYLNGLDLGQITRFCITGVLAWIVDTVTLNGLLHWGTPPLLAKVGAAIIATIFSWGLNRNWAFSSPKTKSLRREAAQFALANILGMLPPLVCLLVSHYGLGLISPLADTISANVIGLFFGTILRYVLYKRVVFRDFN